MEEAIHRRQIAAIRGTARVLDGSASDYDPLLETTGTARIVLLGEASHGTHEFYSERARITRRLIEEKGFTAVAVEADWPDAYRVNRFVRGVSGESALDALDGFKRFPTWMWRNTDVLEFVRWLRAHNDARPPESRAGFYGLDLYSLHQSIHAVLEYLGKVDPDAARRARYRYSCFEDFGEDSQAYGYAASFGLTESCEREGIEQLLEMQRRAADLAQRDGRLPADEFFFAEQNARLVRNAEEYYRTMFQGRVSSWNLRDRHMGDTLDALVTHLDKQAGRARVAVWAHNSHVGDARETQMGETGEFNVGQLARERYGREAVLAGFTTFRGTVTAASEWGGIAERKRVRPGLPGSYEELFHSVGLERFLLMFGGGQPFPSEPRLERAIGVIYRPESERISHYFRARLHSQFDAVIHIDETRAVEPLDVTPEWEAGEVWETYPTGV